MPTQANTLCRRGHRYPAIGMPASRDAKSRSHGESGVRAWILLVTPPLVFGVDVETDPERAGLDALVSTQFERRLAPGLALAAQSEAIANACRDMATRFRQGGKRIVFGNGLAGADAQHVAVGCLHPVIVGKSALPAVALVADAATLSDVATRRGWDETFSWQLHGVGAAEDIALGIVGEMPCQNVIAGLRVAARSGMLTVALVPADSAVLACVDHQLVTATDDPTIAREVRVTLYHLLWELVHVFLEQPADEGRPR